MAKAPKNVKAPEMNLELLAAIHAKTLENSYLHVSQADGKPLLDAGLIDVNTSLLDDNGNAAAITTEKGRIMVEGNAPTQAPSASGSKFAVLSAGVVLPKVTRVGGGNKTAKYPIDIEIGATFFVANSDVDSGDANKTMSATVANWNEKFKEETGETETVTRSVRGPDRKNVFNADGSKQMETVERAIKKATRKYVCRPVVGGKKYGEWTAPADGVLVARVALD